LILFQTLTDTILIFFSKTAHNFSVYTLHIFRTCTNRNASCPAAGRKAYLDLLKF